MIFSEVPADIANIRELVPISSLISRKKEFVFGFNNSKIKQGRQQTQN